jgi:hypothetical protein
MIAVELSRVAGRELNDAIQLHRRQSDRCGSVDEFTATRLSVLSGRVALSCT